MSKELGLIEIDFEDFVNEILPRTREGYYIGEKNQEKYEDFKRKHPDGKGFFVQQFGYGDRILIRFYSK